MNSDRAVVDRLTRLKAHGFAILPLPNLVGEVDGLYAVRLCHGFADAVVVRSVDCAAGVRVRDDFDVNHPFQTPQTLWSRVSGVGVIDGLLALPRPEPSLPEPQPQRGSVPAMTAPASLEAVLAGLRNL